MSAVDVDYLVIGSGLAGLNAALELAQHGTVAVLTKRKAGESATAHAQGGIASVMDADDTFDSHVTDTLEAGAGLCDERVVHSVVSDGPRAIEQLVRRGVSFDRNEAGYDLGREGGHSARRILHAQDITGREIDRVLQARVAESAAIHHLTDHIAIDLITLDKIAAPGSNRCIGAYALDDQSGQVITVRARATLLATGGAGKIYFYTSNPDVATGDGVAMAYRAGATLANLEFFQFHPTSLYHPHAKSFLISEALRGEGGILRRWSGTPLMHGVHPRADLAPRDIVARAIDAEMKRSGDDCVFLDMTHLDEAFIEQRFPNIHSECLSFGIDMAKDRIPVVPAAHYMCGGVVSALDGATTLPGLWVAGESSCTGLHGANRLASNSLLEAAVMSERAANAMQDFSPASTTEVQVPDWDPGNASDPDEQIVVSHNWDEVRRLMWNYVGVVRSDKRLDRAKRRIRVLQDEIHQYYWDFKVTHDLVELRNVATLAELVIACAASRRESRGLHHNIDCPSSTEDYRRDTCLRRESDGQMRLFEGRQA